MYGVRFRSHAFFFTYDFDTRKFVLYDTSYLIIIIIFLTAHPVLPQFLGPIWLPHFAPVFKNGTYQIYRKTLHINPESSVFLSIWQMLLPRMIELNGPFLKKFTHLRCSCSCSNFLFVLVNFSTGYNFVTILSKTHYKILKILPNLYPHMGMEGWKYTL